MLMSACSTRRSLPATNRGSRSTGIRPRELRHTGDPFVIEAQDLVTDERREIDDMIGNRRGPRVDQLGEVVDDRHVNHAHTFVRRASVSSIQTSGALPSSPTNST